MDIKKKIKKWYKRTQENRDIDPKVEVVPADNLIFDKKYLIYPENTAGSDDYHTTRMIFTVNLKEAKHFNLNFRIACVTFYEKEDPDKPAAIVFDDSDFGDYIQLHWK